MNLDVLRNKPHRAIVGLMSGTSCDGIDAALCRIAGTGPGLRLEFIHLASFPYPESLRARLLTTQFGAEDLCLLNFDIGERLAAAVLEVMAFAETRGLAVDAVASHGHTIAHMPPRAGRSCGTLQIGEAAVIAERTGLTVVSDFRPRDMAAGGQGAPLVPYADWALFARPDRTVATLNIGGIANLSVVTPRLDGVMAFDTGPGNMAIDGAVRLLTHDAQTLDQDGAAAARGKILPDLLEALLAHPYFDKPPPKSTGREEFGPGAYLRDALGARQGESFDDLVATVTEAVARSIAGAFDRFIRPHHDLDALIVSGGGAHNKTLVARIAAGLPQVNIETSDRYGIPVNAREAVAFALLGNETICGTPANVPRATGARGAVVLGKITPAG